MCQSTFTFWSIVVITLDRTRFNINVQQLREEIKKELNAIVSQNSIIKELISGFNVKLFIVENDAGSSFSVCTNTVRATRYKIVPVFVELTVQGKDHIQIPLTIYDLYTIYDSRYVPIYAVTIPNNSVQNHTKNSLVCMREGFVSKVEH